MASFPPAPSPSSEKDPDSSSSGSSSPSLSPKRPVDSEPIMHTSRPLIDFCTFALYPLTLLAGSLFSHLSPSAASSTSYFSHKSNIFNTLFVKQGWLWTTLAFLVHLSTLRRPLRTQALLRYALATAWWIAVTQWFFGAPIMDRTFRFTGGTCEAVKTDESVRERIGPLTAVLTSAACKVAGGRWAGGHDLSGHTFMLTHASMFLWSEIAPTLVAGWGRVGGYGGKMWGVLACLGVWWWMLLMTGVYFHTWREKLTGWIASLVEWVAVYFWALKTQPAMRAIIGIPGV